MVIPLGLVAKGRIWYLVANVDQQTRTYRISRIQSAQIVDETAQRPPDFDLAAFWKESSAQFKANLPRFCATFRVDPAILSDMRYAGHIEYISAPDDNELITVEVRFDVELQARAYALGFGSQLEVLSPLELRDSVLRLAHEVIERHA